MTKVKELPLHKLAGVALLDRAIQYWTSDPEEALDKVSKLEQEDLDVSYWTEAEMKKLDQGIERWQDDMEEIAKGLSKKTVADVVNFIYLSRPQM